MKTNQYTPDHFNPVPDPTAGNSHGRKSIRLKGYDYSKSCGYFVTIVTQLHKPFFGKICNGEMLLNDAGRMVMKAWASLPERFSNIAMDVFQVMPNHLHAILFIHDPKSVGAGLVPAHYLVPAPGLACTKAAGIGVPAPGRATTRVALPLGISSAHTNPSPRINTSRELKNGHGLPFQEDSGSAIIMNTSYAIRLITKGSQGIFGIIQ
jgi:hypothetical protein